MTNNLETLGPSNIGEYCGFALGCAAASWSSLLTFYAHMSQYIGYISNGLQDFDLSGYPVATVSQSATPELMFERDYVTTGSVSHTECIKYLTRPNLFYRVNKRCVYKGRINNPTGYRLSGSPASIY